MERCILHCDLNNFFASVECREHPEWDGKPVAVCGSEKDRHGIVLAKNEAAKRFGVKTAEPVWEAQRKCPGLILAPPHFEKYLFFSQRMRELYSDYTDQVEPFGIDECWLDVTGSRRLFGDGTAIARRIRARSKEEYGLTVSVGVSFNKVFAKLGSDMKKPDATTLITPENFRGKIWPLPAGAMLGVGKKTEKRLASMGIFTIGELAATREAYLTVVFGKAGGCLWRNANGRDGSAVSEAGYAEPPKSIGNSITCVRDLYEGKEVWPVLLYLSEKVSRRLRSEGMTACGLQLSVKDSRLHTGQHQKKLAWPTRLTEDLARAAHQLFQESYQWKNPVRALGVCAFSLFPDSCTRQASLFHNMAGDEKTEHLECSVQRIRKKFGGLSVRRAVFLMETPLPGRGRRRPEQWGKF